MPSAEVAYSRLVLMLLTYPEIAEVESPAKDANANLIRSNIRCRRGDSAIISGFEVVD